MPAGTGKHASLIDLEMRTGCDLRQRCFVDLEMRAASVLRLHRLRRFLFAPGNFLRHFALRRLRRALLETRRVGFARLDITEHRADRVSSFHLRIDLRDLARARRRHAHDGLVRLDFDDFLVGGDFVARLNLDRDDRRFGHRFAELRHGDWNFRHKIIRREPGALWPRSSSRSGRCSLQRFG